MSLDKHSTWVVIFDSINCRIYHYHKNPEQLTLFKEINHPENHLKDIDLTSDKPGRYSSGTSGHGTYSQPTDPKEIKVDSFSREIAKELDHHRKINAYDKLIIISPPHMNGLLFQHINKHVKDLVTHNLEKDLLHLTNRELMEYLHKNIV